MLRATQARLVRFPHLRKLNGAEGLVLAIICQGMKDVYGLAYRDDALEYFESDAYLHHLTWLGLPLDWLPDGIERG